MQTPDDNLPVATSVDAPATPDNSQVETEKVEDGKTKKEEEIPAWAQMLIQENRDLKETVDFLKDAAGKNALASYKDGKRDFSVKTCYLKTVNGKIIVGWGKLDLKHYNPRGIDAVAENMFIDLDYLDGSKEKVNYMDFVRSTDRVVCDIIEIKGEKAKLKIQENGQEIDINIKFINS